MNSLDLVKLTALMEHLPPAATEADHKLHLERLKGVYELARDLGAGKPPLLQTVLGDGSWDTLKNLFALLEHVAENLLSHSGVHS